MTPTRDQLIDLILRETTDKVTADGVQIAAPNILEVGCRHVRGDPKRGYENPAQAAREFASFIADAMLACFAPLAEALSECDARRRLIQRIEQWDGETEYDAEDIAALADDILHEFNGAPVIARPEALDEGAAGERDFPAEFEAWWKDYKHRNRENADYWLKKQIAFDAFHFAARAHPSPTPAADADRVREATGAEAVIRDEQIVISIDVDALPGLLSGSIGTNSVAGLFKVTDPAEFAKEVCGALNAEKEDGTTRVHMMFDSAFNHAIDQGAEGVEEITEDEFEAEAQRIQSDALAVLKSEVRP